MGTFFAILGSIFIFGLIADRLIKNEEKEPNPLVAINLIYLGYLVIIVIVFMPFETALCFGWPASVFLSLLNMNYNDRVADHGLWQTGKI